MNPVKLLLAAVASIGMVGSASAAPITGQISLLGYAQAVGSVQMGSATGVSFANASGSTVSGTSGLLSNFGAGSGTFASLGACSSTTTGCGTIKNIASFTTSAPISQFITLTTGGPSVSFDLASITNVQHPAGDFLVFNATGTLHFSGFDDTAGTFSFSAQGDNIVSFSATTLSAGTRIPEPASLAILGSSLAAIGLLRRKRTT